MIPYIIQGPSIILFVNGIPNTIDKSHLNYSAIQEALKAEDWDSVKELATVQAAINKQSFGRVTIVDGQLLFDGVVMHNAISKRILQMMEDGFPVTNICKFMERLDANPSYRARQELYGFLDACQLPITDDGYFLAYKKIRADWKDVYTGTIDNSIGATPTMPRRNVNENPNETCSAGLHVCSYSYLSHYPGERIVSVKVDPADVVSVPVDYNNAKMRVCKYTVMAELDVKEAQNEDILSKRTTKSKSRSVEDVFDELDDTDVHAVFEYFGMATCYDDPLDELLTEYTYREIRTALTQLGLM